MTLPMEQIRRLVGDIDEAPFEHVDHSVTENVGLFVPLTGQCHYAVTPEHTHPSYSFVVSFDNSCEVAIDGRIVRSTAGTFSAFSPGVPHQELPSDAPSRYIAIMIERGYFETALAGYAQGALSLRGDTFPTTPRLLASLREFMAECEGKLPGHGQLLAAAELRITHLLIRQVLAPEQRPDRVCLRMAANHAVEFMHSNIAEKLTVTDLARVARLSPSHFARVFKAEMGMAPIEYLQELRLLFARRYLRDTQLSVTEVALQCGFNSSSYLTRCFAARFRVTPSAFRKSIGVSR